MVEQLVEPEYRATDWAVEPGALDWKAALNAELDRAIVQGGGRWSRALMAVAWIHLLAFLVCHTLQVPEP